MRWNCVFVRFFWAANTILSLVIAPVSAETVRGTPNIPSNPGVDMAPDGTGHPRLPTEAQKRAASQLKISGSGINYNGGPVMAGFVPNVYFIWYGNWARTNGNYALSNAQAVTILKSFMSNISGSGWLTINSSYYLPGTSPTYVSNSVGFSDSFNYFDSYSLGTSLSDSAIWSIVSNAISTNNLPLDDKGIYFVLTSGDVQKSGFGTSYCGWHTSANYGNTNIKYSFVGNPFPSYPTACAVQSSSPNGNAGADAMASVIAHELVETISDPNLNAWYDRRGYENADKCAWKFGSTSSTPNTYSPPGSGTPGGSYNVTFGTGNSTTYWLIQQNWKNSGSGSCAVN